MFTSHSPYLRFAPHPLEWREVGQVGRCKRIISGQPVVMRATCFVVSRRGQERNDPGPPKHSKHFQAPSHWAQQRHRLDLECVTKGTQILSTSGWTGGLPRPELVAQGTGPVIGAYGIRHAKLAPQMPFLKLCTLRVNIAHRSLGVCSCRTDESQGTSEERLGKVRKTNVAVFKNNTCTVMLFSDSSCHPEEDASMSERLCAKRLRWRS